MATGLGLTRAAFLELWRSKRRPFLFPVLLLLTDLRDQLLALATSKPLGHFAHPPIATGLGLLLLVLVMVPALSARGVQRWVSVGPLGLLGLAGRSGESVWAYGLATALWAIAPVSLLSLLLLARMTSEGAVAFAVGLAVLVVDLSLIGAALGKIARSVPAAVIMAWAASGLSAAFLVWSVGFFEGFDGVLGAFLRGTVPLTVLGAVALLAVLASSRPRRSLGL